MFAKLVCLAALLASSHGAPSDDVIRQYYANYQRMDDQRLRSELLVMWISTAGDGDFDLKERIGAPCRRLATAAADAWQHLPTLELAAPLIDAAIAASVAELRTIQPTATHPMEKVCHHLEQSLQLEPAVNAVFLRFQRQPKGAPELAANAKRLTGVATVAVNRFYGALLSAPKVGQLMAHGMFVEYERSRNCALAEYRLAKAIVELAKRAEWQDQVQLLYEKGLYDTVQFALQILDRDQNTTAVPVFQITNGALMARVRDNFQKDAKMWPAIETAQKEVNTTVCKGTR